jgi:pyruvate,water dikinase
MPSDVEQPIRDRLARLGSDVPCAVRSSATAEDLPSSSFAGQQDTYLNVRGADAVLCDVRRCWASLFTDRAVAYRIKAGFDHRAVQLSVVVQRMVFPEAAGIMFTADPVSSNRKVVSIDAGFGLGEAMVSGLVTPDTYRVRSGTIVEKKISTQTTELRPAPGGGTEEHPVEPARRHRQTLSDEQIVALARLGRRIEAHFGTPQDIEWGLVDGELNVLQSRPITTLYPVPEATDGRNHVYMSYGHRQMMTDAFRPLGLSLFLILDEFLGRPPMSVAGNRFYKDMSYELSSPITRRITLKSLGQVDVLMTNALRAVLAREEFTRGLAKGKASVMNFGKGGPLPMAREFVSLYRRDDPTVVPELIAQNERSVELLRHEIAHKSGEDLFRFILDDHRVLTDIMFEPRSVAAAFLGIHAANWINKHIAAWLGETGAADVIAQSADHNVVAAMGLELLDVADVVRRYPEVIAYLEHAERNTFIAGLADVRGGPQTRLAIEHYLHRYGMHCSGDIDFTRTRWSEDPTQLVPLILGNVKNFPAGAHQARQEQGRADAQRKIDELLERLRALPGGRRKANRAAKYMSLLRHFIGYREYSKHACLQRYWLYKEALLREARTLAQRGIVREPEDVYFLTFEEFRAVVRTGRLDYSLIHERREAHEVYAKLSPPRVITSEGEVFNGEYDSGHVPAGALAGIAVSSGVVEGPARVVLDLTEADVAEGDILVTVYTDPSWSTLFVSAKGVVMEVGGVMTHGAVVAREYGLPAVVGVENATGRIRDGQLIRVNGSDGYVELLED